MTDYPLAVVRNELSALVGDLRAAELLPKHLRGKPADLMLIMLTGQELGLGPMQAIRSIHVIEGKPTLSADLMAAQAMRSPVCIYLRPVVSTPERATYETLRKGWPEPMAMSFTIEEAKAAGLASKDNWRKFPAAMLRARCIAALVRAAYPDLMMGIYDPDELDDRGEPQSVGDVRVIDVSPDPAPKASRLKAKLAAPTGPSDAVQLRDAIDEIAAWLREHNATESDLRSYIEDTQGALPPPVARWTLETARAVLAKLRNGWGAKLAAGLSDPTPDPTHDPHGAPDGLDDNPFDVAPE